MTKPPPTPDDKMADAIRELVAALDTLLDMPDLITPAELAAMQRLRDNASAALAERDANNSRE